MKLNPLSVRLQISNLLLQYPELAEDEILRADAIEGQTDALELIAMLVRQVGETKALSEGTAGYVQDLNERRARLDRRIEATRALIQKIMDDAKLPKLELPEATLSIRTGTPKVVLTDENALPEDCVKTVRSPDKATIKLKLAAGQQVPGACLSNAEPSLTIRTR